MAGALQSRRWCPARQFGALSPFAVIAKDQGDHAAVTHIRLMLKALPLIALAVVALAAAACTTQTQARFEPLTPAQRTALIQEGREIATSQCASCHAVGLADTSPRPDAPPLRSVLERYDSAALTGNLMIGVRVGHPDMPLFYMGPRGADALVEYLYSMRSPNQQGPER